MPRFNLSAKVLTLCLSISCFDFDLSPRILGFIACSAIGFLLSLIGTFVLFGGTSDNNIRIFAVLYVLGNVIGESCEVMPIF